MTYFPFDIIDIYVYFGEDKKKKNKIARRCS